MHPIFVLDSSEYIPHIFIETVDSLVLNLTHNKKLILNRLVPDVQYDQRPDFHIFELSYFIDDVQFEELRNEKISEIQTTHGSRPLTLRLKRKSQTEVSQAAHSIDIVRH